MFKSFKVGDRVKVIDQEIYGKIVNQLKTTLCVLKSLKWKKHMG
jgi:hypothetical protein